VLRVVLLFLLAAFVTRAIGRLLGGVVDGAVGRAGGATRRPETRSAAARMVKDPVCGTFIVPGRGPHVTRGGETVWFCSDRCREAFERR
jgi:YHS domain-containing protein